ncbi:CopD family protein [Acidiferrobacter sp.]|uniref:CopD family protein n=1 Tax=Acidiferrobacter sp. TaxID=1872107 RepID=UPI002638A376|nr:CopD family protein [Acidiferrobacter sp.]
MSYLIAIHGLFAVLWVGGMFFAYMILRPAAQPLEAAQRLSLWARTFGRFFPWVWGAVVVLPVSGYYLAITRFGGMAALPPFINIMQVLGIVMILLYLHIFFAPYRRLRQGVVAGDFVKAGHALGQIRRLVAINMVLGLITIFIALVGAN